MNLSDSAVIRLEEDLLRGNIDGTWDILCAYYRPRVSRWLRGLSGGRYSLSARCDPSDITQNVFLLAHRRIHQASSKGCRFSVWLMGIALECLKHAVRDNLAKKRDPRRETPVPDGSSTHPRAAGSGPASAVARAEVQALVRKLLERLPPRERQVAWLRILSELTNNEVAAALGVKPPAASQRYAKALEILRNIIDQDTKLKEVLEQ